MRASLLLLSRIAADRATSSGAAMAGSRVARLECDPRPFVYIADSMIMEPEPLVSGERRGSDLAWLNGAEWLVVGLNDWHDGVSA